MKYAVLKGKNEVNNVLPFFPIDQDVPEGATQFKCCPPVRGSDHREALWEAVKDGVIELVVSDHAPCTPQEKLLDAGTQCVPDLD